MLQKLQKVSCKHRAPHIYAFHGLEHPDSEAGTSLASVLLPIWHVAGRTSDHISLISHVIVTCLFCILHKPMAARRTQYCA